MPKKVSSILNNFKLYIYGSSFQRSQQEPTSSKVAQQKTDAPVDMTSHKVLLAQPGSAEAAGHFKGISAQKQLISSIQPWKKKESFNDLTLRFSYHHQIWQYYECSQL